jgi:hypothetical protein
LERNLQLKQYDLTKKDIVDVKDERSNINTMTIAFKSIISEDNLGVEESFQGTCFVHVFFFKLVNMQLQKRNLTKF